MHFRSGDLRADLGTPTKEEPKIAQHRLALLSSWKEKIMFVFIEGLPPDVLAIEARGEVTHHDYRNTLIPNAEEMTRRFSKVWDHAANKRKALFLSSWNCSTARVGEGETDFNILSAKPIREKMFRGASSLRFV